MTDVESEKAKDSQTLDEWTQNTKNRGISKIHVNKILHRAKCKTV